MSGNDPKQAFLAIAELGEQQLTSHNIRVKERLPRKLVAILYADVAGYSRLTGQDEDATHRTLSEYLDLINSTVTSHNGQVMHYAGDAVLAQFTAVLDALSTAVAIQNELRTRNENLPDERKVQFRIGVNSGDVIEDRGDIYGDGVNVAARLESLANPGGICISDAVRSAVGKKLDLDYADMGEQEVKNIEEPVRVYKVMLPEKQKPVPTSPATPTLELPDIPSIAVLPFTNMSGDPEQEYFSDGITEDIITALSRISNLLVVARHSTLGYKGKAVDIKQIGREQGVRYVLEGSVRKSGNRVRVTAQLIDATTRHHCWADRYDRELDDIFAVQDEITQNVTVALQVTLTEGEQARVYAGGTNNVEAWECAVRGKELLERHIKEANIEAQRLLERAVRLDPEYATAWVYLGWMHWENARWGWGASPESSLDRAFELGRKALELEKDHPDSFALFGFSHMLLGEFDQAVTMAEKAVTLAPNHAFITAISAVVLRAAGRMQDALRRIKRAMRLSPIYPSWYLIALGSIYHLIGDQNLAVATLREACQREPESILPKAWFVSALMEARSEQEARSVAEDILRNEPGFSRQKWVHILQKDPKVRTRLSENLRKAGLPE